MSRARHMKKASGGKVTVFAGEGSNNLKEARERKRGGKVEHMHAEGEHVKHRHDRKERRRGGHVEHEKERKHGGKAEHEEHHERKAGGAVPGRKRGGGIGANRTPLSTAANIKEVTKGESAEDMGEH